VHFFHIFYLIIFFRYNHMLDNDRIIWYNLAVRKIILRKKPEETDK